VVKINKLITNNPVVKSRLGERYDVEYHDASYLDILTLTRDYIHQGHKLLTHPLSGSVKPKETPYKSIVISNAASELDVQSLSIIEESIACVGCFVDRDIPESALADFMEIDCSLIASASEPHLAIVV
jgi:hypothetical protein